MFRLNDNRRFLAVAALMCFCVSVGSAAQGPADSQALTEVEALQGENLTLKLDSLDKQARLMQEQFARLQEAQRDLVRQLQALEKNIIEARGFKAGAAAVDWASKIVAPVRKPEVKSAPGQ